MNKKEDTLETGFDTEHRLPSIVVRPEENNSLSQSLTFEKKVADMSIKESA